MSDVTTSSGLPDEPAAVEDSALQGGSYDVIRQRLQAQGRELAAKAGELNAARQTTFGGSELAVSGQHRIRTENNCVPVDIASVGSYLLFGYNVFIGLKRSTAVDDVFSLHCAEQDEGGELRFVPVDDPRATGFLHDPSFVKEFEELYHYYSAARLVRLSTTESKLLAIFRTGEKLDDIKVFRWALAPDGALKYIDNRGERDEQLPPAHDFQWTPTSQKDHLLGRHPHISILDEVFVETVGGDLTIKVEDNTEDGLGIYREPVQDRNQSLDDADVSFAKLGGLILIRVLPFQEEDFRYLVFNSRTQKVLRIDSIGESCIQLPDDHGLIFPGGYCLQTGDAKVFADATDDLRFKRRIPSPNGEDVLYVFLRSRDGLYVLLPYNRIRKEVSNPIRCHGYSIFEDGSLVVFRVAGEEPTRVHPVQIWSTPFVSAEFHAASPSDDTELGRIGNAELVRGISDSYTVSRLVDEEQPTRATYEALVASCDRLVDNYYWLGQEEVGDLLSPLKKLRATAELIIDEFEKVQLLQQQAVAALVAAEDEQKELLATLRVEDFRSVDHYMKALTDLRTRRGHLISLRELRFVDLGRIDAFEEQVKEQFERVSRACVDFLLDGTAFTPLTEQIDELLVKVEACSKVSELKELGAEQGRLTEGLDVLTEVISGLQIDDATARTAILEAIGEVFAHLNRVRAIQLGRRRDLGSHEARADFGAQFKLLGQSVASAAALADSPEACDEELSRLMLQLEELEARFGEYDEFLPQLTAKREEVYEALGARKQELLDRRGRRVANLVASAERILDGLNRRARAFATEDELNAWFASDAMVLKLRQISEQLAEVGEAVKGEEILSRLTTARQEALRGLRDRLDLFADGDSLITLGRHSFAVNTQAIELTMLPQGEAMRLQLTGTDYSELLDDEAIQSYSDCWMQSVGSESPDVYRSEYLASSILRAAEQGVEGLSLSRLSEVALSEDELLALVREFTSERYQEGYERGVHDVDGARILRELLVLKGTAGLLRFPAGPRAAAMLYWAASAESEAGEHLRLRAKSLGRLRDALGTSEPLMELASEAGCAIEQWLAESGIEIPLDASARELGGRYLVEELQSAPLRLTVSAEAGTLREAVRRELEDRGLRSGFAEDLSSLAELPAERFELARAWCQALAPDTGTALEAVAYLLTESQLDHEVSSAQVEVELEGLLGQHPRLGGGKLKLRLDEFLQRLDRFERERRPRFAAWRELRHETLVRERERLRVDEYMPKVMSAFVRNRLINEVYLPMVGDNLAKQIGAAGDSRRTDQMGLLLLVSPPGYGKTTLMEYIANRLGLVFMKVNGPALGHDVTSLDPAEAPNATARQEVEKINLALELGNNVMLYLDDIQHTNPELLQKFISLCDATRRIEGVWNGRTRTYDLRGKKFCVVMAGNPYTESGDRFQVPDMLANRADTYNLGDILDGRDESFALSYIENTLTSSQTLAPLAARDPADLHKLIRLARGEEVPTGDLSHGYSAVELGEITRVLQLLGRVQEVVLQVNQQYIASAAQEDAYRTEPPFKLQGSYRNMNKMAEKVVSAMNDEELERVIDDHYVGEAQTLTSGAEHNLLKLKQLRGTLSEDESERWAGICKEFARRRMMGAGDDDPVTRVTGVLGALEQRLEGIQLALSDPGGGELGDEVHEVSKQLALMRDSLVESATSLASGESGKEVVSKLGTVGRQLGAIHKVLADDSDEKRLDARIYGVGQEIAGVREGLDRAVSGLGALNLLEWLAPEIGHIEDRSDVARVQREVLLQAQEALAAGRDGVLPPLGQRDAVLAGTLPIIQELFVAISEATSETLSDAAWEELMDQLRGHVAGAVTRLAREGNEA